jgi:hypothetical protein
VKDRRLGRKVGLGLKKGNICTNKVSPKNKTIAPITFLSSRISKENTLWLVDRVCQCVVQGYEYDKYNKRP